MLHFYKYYVFVVTSFIILCYKQRPKINLNYIAFRASKDFKPVVTLMWKVKGTAAIKVIPKATTRFFYKQHFYKQRQAEIGKKLSKN